MAEVSEDTGGYASTTTSDGYTVSGNTETAEAMAENLSDGKEEGDLSKAASELGKKGGKASAEKRAAVGSGDGKEPASDGSSDSEADPESKPLGKPRDDPKARMLEATRKEAEAKRELQAERQERQRLAQELAQEREARKAPAAPPAKTKGPEDEPDIADYDDYAEFVKASTRWAARQEYSQLQQRAGVQRQAQAYAQAVDGVIDHFKERIDKAKESDAEFMDRVSPDVWDKLSPSFQLEAGQPPTALNVLADEVISSEHAPAILLHFSDNPSTFQRIASLQTPRAIAREVAKLEARFEAATTDTSSKPSVSKAKAPVRSVTGSPSAVERDENDMSFDEFYVHDSKRAARR